MKLADPMRMSSVNEARKLGHLDVFLENAIEQCIVKIKLSHSLVIRDGKSEHHLNGSRFDDRTIGIMKIETRNLVESFGHQPGLILVHRTIRVVFVGNLGLLRSHALDCVGCIQIYHNLSKSITTDKHVFKII